MYINANIMYDASAGAPNLNAIYEIGKTRQPTDVIHNVYFFILPVAMHAV